MSLIAAKCTQCGSDIEVDDTKESAVCRHCGTHFMTEKIIRNYNTNVYANITKNIYGREKFEADEYILNGEQFLTLNDWERAEKAFTQAAELAPGNYRCWLGFMRCATQNFTNLDNESHVEYYQKALTVASDAEKIVINEQCEEYLKLRKEFEEYVNPILNDMNRIANICKILWAFVTGGIGFSIIPMVLGFSFMGYWLILGFFGVALLAVGIVSLIIIKMNQKKLKELCNTIKLANDKILRR